MKPQSKIFKNRRADDHRNAALSNKRHSTTKQRNIIWLIFFTTFLIYIILTLSHNILTHGRAVNGSTLLSSSSSTTTSSHLHSTLHQLRERHWKIKPSKLSGNKLKFPSNEYPSPQTTGLSPNVSEQNPPSNVNEPKNSTPHVKIKHHSFSIPDAKKKHSATITTTTTSIHHQHPPHPRATTHNKNNQWNIIHDPTILHHSPLPFTIPPDQHGAICAPPGLGPEGPGGYRLLTEKIAIDDDDDDDDTAAAKSSSSSSSSSSRPKLFCAVYSNDEYMDRVRAIGETWGGRCDGFLAVSTNRTVASLGVVEGPYRMGSDKTRNNNLWQRVRWLVRYIHDLFLEEYDFFHITSDDSYLIVENMRLFLESEDVVREGGGVGYPLPLYIGQWRMLPGNKTHFVGGGYTINKSALSSFVKTQFKTCYPRKMHDGEDKLMGDCMRRMGVVAYDARDDFGEQRYHSFDPEFIYSFIPESSNFGDVGNYWTKQTIGMPVKLKLEAASNVSVSFRNIKSSTKMRRIHRLLYRQHENEHDCPTYNDGTNDEKHQPPVDILTNASSQCHPYRNCLWDAGDGAYKNCPEYDKLTKQHTTTSNNDNNNPATDHHPDDDTPPRPHPHAGARDENGRWNYIHDPTILRRRRSSSSLSFTISPDEYGAICAPPAHGPEGLDGYRLLTEKIMVDHENRHRAAEDQRETTPPPRNIKLFCAIYTYSGGMDRVKALAETWGQKCDGFMAASNQTVPEWGVVNMPHYGEGQGEYGGIWQRVRSILGYVYDNFLEDYDWFHLSGDDTYLIVENMKMFLGSDWVVEDEGGKDCPKPMYVGQRIYIHNNRTYYLGGGSGYTINRMALSMLVTRSLPTCLPFMEHSAEDRYMGQCMRNMGIQGYDDRDELGEYRYHGFDPQFVASFRPGTRLGKVEGFWTDQMKGKPLKIGLYAASKQSVAFHEMKTPAKMRRIHKILYRQHEMDCTVDGVNEPGVVVSEETIECSPLRYCIWDTILGRYVDCPPYENITKRGRSEPDYSPRDNKDDTSPGMKSSSRQQEQQQPRSHPHAGAKDENDHWGYIHDPTVLRQSTRRLPFAIPTDEYNEICAPPGQGPEGSGGYRLLTEKVVVDREGHRDAERQAGLLSRPRVRLFCVVITHGSRIDQIKALAETWGRRCDGFMAVSNKTVREWGVVNVPFDDSGGDDVNSWQRIRSILGYIYDSSFLEKYDFFHFTQDDAYLIVENMRLFLESPSVVRAAGLEKCPRPLFIGHWKIRPRMNTYTIGGGYTISRTTISIFIKHLSSHCNINGNDDDRMGECLGKIGVFGMDARDANGSDRYHMLDPESLYSFIPGEHDDVDDNWLRSVSALMPNYSRKKDHLDAASNVTVSFRKLDTPAKIWRVHKILYRNRKMDCRLDEREVH